MGPRRAGATAPGSCAGRGSRRTRLVLALALVAACDRTEEPGARELLELERLAFVPAAACNLLPDEDLSLARAIVIDRYEFTRADLQHYWPGRARPSDALPWQSDEVFDRPERADWPAFVSFHEAEELAGLRGMRLPTPREWLHVAVGRRDYQKPWGGPGREFFANTIVRLDGTDFSLGSPCNVGTYESGRSRPFGCYDLLGNVWEWVDGVVLGSVPTPDAGVGRLRDELDDHGGARASLMGGAYDSAWRPTFELDKVVNRLRFHARRADKDDIGPSFGARMCADAETYLWDKAGRWGERERARERVLAVSRRWVEDDPLARSALRDLLAELRARPGAPAGLAWLEEGTLASP